jgi:hypothetical protein
VRPVRPELNSFDVQLPLIAGVQPLDYPSPLPPDVRLSFMQGLVTIPDFALPMTGYQRIYQWPSVGPVSKAGAFPDKIEPPKELQPVWNGNLFPVSSVPMPFDQVQEDCAPLFSVMQDIGIPRAEIKLMSSREAWTVLPTDPIAFSVHPMAVLEGSSSIFKIIGVTKDGSGTPLAGVTVLAAVTDALYALNDPGPPTDPVEATTVSDGSGNYSVTVCGRGAYQLIGYLSGSPDRSGVTVKTIVPVER